jgi:hypothetical protein
MRPLTLPTGVRWPGRSGNGQPNDLPWEADCLTMGTPWRIFTPLSDHGATFHGFGHFYFEVSLAAAAPAFLNHAPSVIHGAIFA